MNIELDGGGKVLFQAPQQRWMIANNGKSVGILETANFAGQQVMAITDDAGAFDLLYLGFKAGGFATMDAAKQAAPEFVRRVLARMSEMIAD